MCIRDSSARNLAFKSTGPSTIGGQDHPTFLLNKEKVNSTHSVCFLFRSEKGQIRLVAVENPKFSLARPTQP